MFGLDQSTKEKLSSVFYKHPNIQEIIVFGSRAKGNFKHGSDIDIAIKAPGMDFSELSKIENEIDDLLLPYKIDILLYHSIKDNAIKEHIDRMGILFTI